MIKENSMRDVMKRADHAGNILNGRPFDAPFAHGPRVVSIKVGNDVIASCIKHVGEMKVAMVSSTHTRDPGVAERRETFAQCILALQDCPGFFLCRLRQKIQLKSQSGERPAHLRHKSMVKTVAIEFCKRFGRKFRYICSSAQGDVQLCGAAS